LRITRGVIRRGQVCKTAVLPLSYDSDKRVMGQDNSDTPRACNLRKRSPNGHPNLTTESWGHSLVHAVAMFRINRSHWPGMVRK